MTPTGGGWKNETEIFSLRIVHIRHRQQCGCRTRSDAASKGFPPVVKPRQLLLVVRWLARPSPVSVFLGLFTGYGLNLHFDAPVKRARRRIFFLRGYFRLAEVWGIGSVD